MHTSNPICMAAPAPARMWRSEVTLVCVSLGALYGVLFCLRLIILPSPPPFPAAPAALLLQLSQLSTPWKPIVHNSLGSREANPRPAPLSPRLQIQSLSVFPGSVAGHLMWPPPPPWLLHHSIPLSHLSNSEPHRKDPEQKGEITPKRVYGKKQSNSGLCLYL